MSDPRHPAKIVVVVDRGGAVNVWMDKRANVRVFVADYDTETCDRDHPDLGMDRDGTERVLWEMTTTVDTMAVRNIINKRGGGRRDG